MREIKPQCKKINPLSLNINESIVRMIKMMTTEDLRTLKTMSLVKKDKDQLLFIFQST
jgi:hypothetical protein